MTRAEIEDAVAAGVISAAVLDTLAKQPKARAHLDVRVDAGATGRRRDSDGDPLPVADTSVRAALGAQNRRLDRGAGGDVTAARLPDRCQPWCADDDATPPAVTPMLETHTAWPVEQQAMIRRSDRHSVR